MSQYVGICLKRLRQDAPGVRIGVTGALPQSHEWRACRVMLFDTDSAHDRFIRDIWTPWTWLKNLQSQRFRQGSGSLDFFSVLEIS
jgi:hypothetical protein